jgi:hypothetical protein
MARGRDQQWAAIYTAAERLDVRYCEHDTLTVRAFRHRHLTGVVEGLQVSDKWTDYLEPVRKQRVLSQTWRELQPVQDAASKIGEFFRERPDLATFGTCEFCRDPRERATEMEQLATKLDSSDLLLRCPRCRTLWDCAAFGREDAPITAAQARRSFPDVTMDDR